MDFDFVVDFNSLFNFQFINYFQRKCPYSNLQVDRLFFSYWPTKKEFKSKWLLFFYNPFTKINYFGFEFSSFALLSKIAKPFWVYAVLAYLPFIFIIVWVLSFFVLGFISLERSRIIFLLLLSSFTLLVLLLAFYVHNILPHIAMFNFAGFKNMIIKNSTNILTPLQSNLLLPMTKHSKFNPLYFLEEELVDLHAPNQIIKTKKKTFHNILDFKSKRNSYTGFYFNSILNSRIWVSNLNVYTYSLNLPLNDRISKHLYYRDTDKVLNYSEVRAEYLKNYTVSILEKQKALVRVWFLNFPSYQLYSSENLLSTLSGCFWPPVVAIISSIGVSYKTNKKRISVFLTFKNKIKNKIKKKWYRKFIVREIYKIHGGIGLMEYSGLEDLYKQKKLKHHSEQPYFSFFKIFKQFLTSIYNRTPSTVVWVSFICWIAIHPINSPTTSIFAWFLLFIFFLVRSNYFFLNNYYKQLFLYFVFKQFKSFMEAKYRNLLLNQVKVKLNFIYKQYEFLNYNFLNLRFFSLWALSNGAQKFTYFFLTANVLLSTTNYNIIFTKNFDNKFFVINCVLYAIVLFFSVAWYIDKSTIRWYVMSGISRILLNWFAISFFAILFCWYFGFIFTHIKISFLLFNKTNTQHLLYVLYGVLVSLLFSVYVVSNKMFFSNTTTQANLNYLLVILKGISKIFIYLIIYVSMTSYFWGSFNLFVFFYYYIYFYFINRLYTYFFYKQTIYDHFNFYEFARYLCIVFLITHPVVGAFICLQYTPYMPVIRAITYFFLSFTLSSIIYFSLFSQKDFKSFKPFFVFVPFILSTWFLFVCFNDFSFYFPGNFFIQKKQLKCGFFLIIWSWSVFRFWRVLLYTKHSELRAGLLLILFPFFLNLVYQWYFVFVFDNFSKYFIYLFVIEIVCLCKAIFKTIKQPLTIRSVRTIIVLLVTSSYMLLVILLFYGVFKYPSFFIVCTVLCSINYFIITLCILPITNSLRSGSIKELQGSFLGFRFVRRFFYLFFIFYFLFLFIVFISIF